MTLLRSSTKHTRLRISPIPPKDTDGRREDSGRGVRELRGRWPGLPWGGREVGGSSVVAPGPYGRLRTLGRARSRGEDAAGNHPGPGWRGRWVGRLMGQWRTDGVRPGVESLAAAPWPGCAPCHSLPDGVVGSRHASDIILTRQPIKRLPNPCQMGQRAFPAASGPSMSSAPRPPSAATGPVCPKSAPTIASPCPSRLFPVPPQRGSVDSG